MLLYVYFFLQVSKKKDILHMQFSFILYNKRYDYANGSHSYNKAESFTIILPTLLRLMLLTLTLCLPMLPWGYILFYTHFELHTFSTCGIEIISQVPHSFVAFITSSLISIYYGDLDASFKEVHLDS